MLLMPTMAGLDPLRVGGFAMEVKTATPSRAAVTCPGAGEGRLGRPGKGALMVGKDGRGGEDLVDGERCMWILHGAYYLSGCGQSGYWTRAGGQNVEESGGVN